MGNEFLTPMKELFPVLIGIVFFLFVMVMTIRKGKQLRHKLEPISLSLGGKISSGSFGKYYVRLMNYEKEQRIELAPGEEATPPSLTLQQFTDLDFDLTIMTENIMTLTMQKLGLDLEMKIGDPIFDEKYLTKSRAKEQAQMFLSSAERRLIIDSFMDAGFTMMTLRRKIFSITKPNYTDQDLDPDLLRSQLDQLHKFING